MPRTLTTLLLAAAVPAAAFAQSDGNAPGAAAGTGTAPGAAPAAADPAAPDPAAAARERRVDEAMDRALKFIAGEARRDANTRVRYWESPYGRNTAVCSMAIMAFLARGHVPGEGPYGELLNEAVDFVVGTQQENGLLTLASSHGPMYEHGISTLMLAEVLGMTTGPRNDRVRKALGKAIQLILKAQEVRKGGRDEGGWRYQPSSSDSDLSVTGWQLMSLRAAANCGVGVQEHHIKKAVQYVLACHDSRQGGFGYQPHNGSRPSMTGTGIVALEVCSQHNTPQAKRGAEFLLRHYENMHWGQDDWWFYTIYYVSQAVYQVKGNDDSARADPNNDWEKFRRRLEDVCLSRQQPDGSFPATRGGDSQAGAAFRTAMTVLSLSVHCKYLPIYQR
jgi:prenyltransferase beta subunit